MSGKQLDGRGCRESGELISAYLDDELDAAELPRLAAHLKACPACSREVDHLMAVKNLLHRSEPYWPANAPPAGFAAAVRDLAALEVSPAVRAAGWGERLIAWGSAALAVALLVTGTALWYRDRAGGGEETLARVEEEAPAPAASDEEVASYLRQHAMGSAARSPFVDYDDAVAFVDYREP